MRDKTFSQLKRFRLIPFAQELRSHKVCAPTGAVQSQNRLRINRFTVGAHLMRDETFSQLQRFRLIPFAQELRSYKSCASPKTGCAKGPLM